MRPIQLVKQSTRFHSLTVQSSVRCAVVCKSVPKLQKRNQALKNNNNKNSPNLSPSKALGFFS